MVNFRITKVTRDNFLRIIGFHESPERFGSRTEIDDFYKLTVAFLKTQKGTIEHLEFSNSPSDSRFLMMMIPGTSLHINLTQPLKDTLSDFVFAFFVLKGFADGDYKAITLAAIAKCMTRISILRKNLGERCLAEVIQSKICCSIDDMFNILNEQGCRYPEACCVFTHFSKKYKRNTCKIQNIQIAQTLQEMEKKNIVRKENNVEPYEWGIIP
jgi:hypothetical protein